MTDFHDVLAVAVAGLAGLGMVTMAALSGWRGWLSLQHQQLLHRLDGTEGAGAGAGTRIEMADLKERIRKLEAIAAGVEL